LDLALAAVDALFEVAKDIFAAGVRFEQIAAHIGRDITSDPGQALGLSPLEAVGGGLE